MDAKYKRGEHVMDRRSNKVWRIKDKKREAGAFSTFKYKLVLVGSDKWIKNKQAYCDYNLSEWEIDKFFVIIGSPELATALYG